MFTPLGFIAPPPPAPVVSPAAPTAVPVGLPLPTIPSGNPFQPPRLDLDKKLTDPILPDPTGITTDFAYDLGRRLGNWLKDLFTPAPPTLERDSRQHQQLENYNRGYAPFYGERVILLRPPFRGGQSYGVQYKVSLTCQYQILIYCGPANIINQQGETIVSGRILRFKLKKWNPVNCPNLAGGPYYRDNAWFAEYQTSPTSSVQEEQVTGLWAGGGIYWSILKILSITRADGQPDTGGDPPGTIPEEVIKNAPAGFAPAAPAAPPATVPATPIQVPDVIPRTLPKGVPDPEYPEEPQPAPPAQPEPTDPQQPEREAPPAPAVVPGGPQTFPLPVILPETAPVEAPAESPPPQNPEPLEPSEKPEHPEQPRENPPETPPETPNRPRPAPLPVVPNPPPQIPQPQNPERDVPTAPPVPQPPNPNQPPPVVPTRPGTTPSTPTIPVPAQPPEPAPSTVPPTTPLPFVPPQPHPPGQPTPPPIAPRPSEQPPPAVVPIQPTPAVPFLPVPIPGWTPDPPGIPVPPPNPVIDPPPTGTPSRPPLLDPPTTPVLTPPPPTTLPITGQPPYWPPVLLPPITTPDTPLEPPPDQGDGDTTCDCCVEIMNNKCSELNVYIRNYFDHLFDLIVNQQGDSSNVCDEPCIQEILEELEAIKEDLEDLKERVSPGQELIPETLNVPYVAETDDEDVRELRTLTLAVINPPPTALPLLTKSADLALTDKPLVKPVRRTYNLLGGDRWQWDEENQAQGWQVSPENLILEAVENHYQPELEGDSDRPQVKTTIQPVTAKNILELLSATLAVSHFRSGLWKYPTEIQGGLISLIDDFPPNRELAYLKAQRRFQDVQDFYQWQLEQLDAILGHWQQVIEIEDTDATEPGQQKSRIVIPNLSEAVTELLGQLVVANINLKALLKMGASNLIETIGARKEAIATQFKTDALIDYLAFPVKERIIELPILATLPDELSRDTEPSQEQLERWNNLERFLQPSKKKIPILEFAGGKTNFQTALVDLLQAAAIIKAHLTRQLPKTKAEFIKQIKDLLGLLNQDELAEDWKRFIEQVEMGWSSDPDLWPGTTQNKPYGRNPEERPRIVDLTREEGSNGTS